MTRVRFLVGVGIFSLYQHVQTGSGAKGSFPSRKQLEHEADHSLPSDGAAENGWSYTFTHPMSWCLIKQWMHV